MLYSHDWPRREPNLCLVVTYTSIHHPGDAHPYRLTSFLTVGRGIQPLSIQPFGESIARRQQHRGPGLALLVHVENDNAVKRLRWNTAFGKSPLIYMQNPRLYFASPGIEPDTGLAPP